MLLDATPVPNHVTGDGRRALPVLSFDSLLGSGGAIVQPILGRVADVSGYPASHVWGAGIRR